MQTVIRRKRNENINTACKKVWNSAKIALMRKFITQNTSVCMVEKGKNNELSFYLKYLEKNKATCQENFKKGNNTK